MKDKKTISFVKALTDWGHETPTGAIELGELYDFNLKAYVIDMSHGCEDYVEEGLQAIKMYQ